MAAESILTSALSSAFEAQGTNDATNSPNVSPGLDPGRYAFELWFGAQRRKEAQRNLDRQFAEKEKLDNAAIIAQQKQTEQNQQAQGLSGMNALANERTTATKQGNLSGFRNGLVNLYS